MPGGAVVPTAGITWITVAPTHRRRGVLTAIMRRQLDELHEQGREPVAALWAAESSIYGRFGYAPASLPGRVDRAAPSACGCAATSTPGPGGSGSVDVDEFRAAAVRLHDQLRRWRARQPGPRRPVVGPAAARRQGPAARATPRAGTCCTRRPTARSPATRPTGSSPRGPTTSEPDGTLRGRARCGRPRRRPTPRCGSTCCRTTSSARSTPPMASADDPVRHLVADSRALHAPPGRRAVGAAGRRRQALSARRYPAPIDLVLEVRDEFCPWNTGRWRLSGHPAGAYCGPHRPRSRHRPRASRSCRRSTWAASRSASLQAAGRVREVSPGAVTLASTAFGWPVTPWCPDEF